MPADGSVRAVIDANMLVSGLFWTGNRTRDRIRAGALTLVAAA